jgi:anti-sigma B factor antagonist
MALSITTNKTDGVIVVRLGGAIYFGEESSPLRIRVKELLEKSSQIVLDLENITRINSGGLGTLVALYTSARKMGGDIKLANLGNHVKEVLQITRLVTVFEKWVGELGGTANGSRSLDANSELSEEPSPKLMIVGRLEVRDEGLSGL